MRYLRRLRCLLTGHDYRDRRYPTLLRLSICQRCHRREYKAVPQ